MVGNFFIVDVLIGRSEIEGRMLVLIGKLLLGVVL